MSRTHPRPGSTQWSRATGAHLARRAVRDAWAARRLRGP
ncbi:hypothetical protein [Kineococcus sp. SYSU DK018]